MRCIFAVYVCTPSLRVAPAAVRITGVETVGAPAVRRTVVHADSVHLHRAYTPTHRALTLTQFDRRDVLFTQRRTPTSAHVRAASGDAVTSHICAVQRTRAVDFRLCNCNLLVSVTAVDRQLIIHRSLYITTVVTTITTTQHNNDGDHNNYNKIAESDLRTHRDADAAIHV